MARLFTPGANGQRFGVLCNAKAGASASLWPQTNLATRLTVAVWCYQSTGITGYRELILQALDLWSGYFARYAIRREGASGKFQGWVQDASSFPTNYVQGTTTIADNIWYHVCMVWDGNKPNIKLYVNGIQEDSNNTVASSIGAAPTATPMYVLIGCESQPGEYWDGGMADGAIWIDEALSPAEVYALASGNTRPDKIRPWGLRAWWPMEDTGPFLIDYSGNGNHAVYTAPGIAIPNNGIAAPTGNPQKLIPMQISMTNSQQALRKFWPGIDALGWIPQVQSSTVTAVWNSGSIIERDTEMIGI